MSDVESVQPRHRSNNPYSAGASPIQLRPQFHPLNILKRGLWMGGSLYFLDRMDTYRTIMSSPDIRHQWFKVGLASSVGTFVSPPFPLMFNWIDFLTMAFPGCWPSCALNYLPVSAALFSIKAYVELYTGKMQKKEVSYKALPQSTHAAIILLCLSGIAFQISLWPVYGGNSMFVMFLVGAFLLNFCLMFPTIVQNIVAFAVLTFFIQEYK